jgi:hypothetical protein
MRKFINLMPTLSDMITGLVWLASSVQWQGMGYTFAITEFGGEFGYFSVHCQNIKGITK